VGNKKYKRSTECIPWRSPLVLVWCCHSSFRFDFEDQIFANVTFARPNFRSVPCFARPFSRESHHFAQPFLYVTKSSRFLTLRVFPFAKIKSSRRNGSLQYCKSPFFSKHLILAFWGSLAKIETDN